MTSTPFSQQGPLRFGLGHFTIFLALYGSMGFAIWRGSDSAREPAMGLWFIGICIAAAALTAAILTHWRQRGPRADGPEIAAWAERERRELTGPGWVRRVLAGGVALGVVLGVPLGAVFATLLAPPEAGTAERVLAGSQVLLATLAWTVPMVFALRWMSLRFPPRSAARS